ncbi:hypothetical protein AVEN_264767-1 [Araneus ventricosus]|uniref:Uncharacterized protein n=1 Tax=Araneus ventricosus TaxID=182803 RepID=A0A4Y2EDC3_ARAVE|nr:hypothetical protein AVEN_264767-1 [Araneus ventricosus]
MAGSSLEEPLNRHPSVLNRGSNNEDDASIEEFSPNIHRNTSASLARFNEIDTLSVLNRGQITRTTPQSALPLQTSATHQREDVWLARFNEHQVHMHGRIFLGIEPRIDNPSVLKPRFCHEANAAD